MRGMRRAAACALAGLLGVCLALPAANAYAASGPTSNAGANAAAMDSPASGEERSSGGGTQTDDAPGGEGVGSVVTDAASDDAEPTAEAPATAPEAASGSAGEAADPSAGDDAAARDADGPVASLAENAPENSADAGNAVEQPVIKVQAHVQDIGWMDPVTDGKVAGTTGQSKHLEALKVTVEGGSPDAIQVQAHVQDIGWMSAWAHNGEIAGTTGKNKQLEAVRIKLSDELSAHYTVWYRAHVANLGWLGWARDGAEAGSAGYGYAIEAVEIVIRSKGESAPGDTATPFRDHADDPASVVYSAHVANIGWQGAVEDGATAGTTGRSLSMEALRTSLSWYGHGGAIEMRTHVQDIGWMSWTTGEAGTTGRSKQLEAVQLRLTGEAAETYDVWYRVHSANVGWLGWTSNGAVAGTTGFGYGVQAIEIRLVPKGGEAPGSTDRPYVGSEEALQGTAVLVGGVSSTSASKETTTIGKAQAANVLQSFSAVVNNKITEGSIRYRALVGQGSDWQGGWSSEGAQVNAGGNGLPLKAVQMQLTGDLAEKYDLWYQVYDSERGWLGWASNGASAGVSGGTSGICAIQVKLVAKGGAVPGPTDNAFVTAFATTPQVLVQAHSANVGWQNPVTSGAAGTTGRGLSLQALRARLVGPVSGSVKINAHVADIGWQGDKSGDDFAGTTGQNRAIQAIRVSLAGDIAAQYDVYYRVHAAMYGWLGWAKNGEDAGTTGLGLQAEAVEIRLVAKGAQAPTSSAPACVSLPSLNVQAHVQDIGWQGAVGSGGTAGTMGQAKRIEALKLSVSSPQVGGGIAYSTHVQDIGWQAEVSNGALAGTTGQGKRVEAVKIRLTGAMATYFDVWYRAYVQDYGWLGWACNGAQAGTGKISYRMEALQVKIVPKGSAAPGSTSGAYTTTPMMPADQLAMLNKANGYSSSTNWLLLANTTTCKVGVFYGSRGNWTLTRYWDCTPGANATPTVLGEFTVTGKGYSFGHGYTCYYYTQFYGDYLFHSIKYYQGTFNVMDGRLGIRASLGCVRLAIQNAKWIYDNIPYGTKVVTYR